MRWLAFTNAKLAVALLLVAVNFFGWLGFPHLG